MEKFEKLNRNEMRNVTGGNLKYCLIKCVEGNLAVESTAPDCSLETQEEICTGAKAVWCTCGVQ